MSEKFAPKTPVQLNPPKNDLISKEELAKANGAEGQKAYVAIKGKVYDVTGNPAYAPGKSYNVFAGKDASRGLGMSSTDAKDARPDWQDLDEKQKKTLNDWEIFFSKRYNVVGIVSGATNMDVDDETMKPT